MSMQLKNFLDLPVFRISCPRIQVEILNYQFNTKMISAKELNRTHVAIDTHLWWNRRGQTQLATSCKRAVQL